MAKFQYGLRHLHTFRCSLYHQSEIVSLLHNKKYSPPNITLTTVVRSESPYWPTHWGKYLSLFFLHTLTLRFFSNYNFVSSLKITLFHLPSIFHPDFFRQNFIRFSLLTFEIVVTFGTRLLLNPSSNNRPLTVLADCLKSR